MPDLRGRLAAGDRLLGCFLVSGSPIAAEMIALAGYDVVLIDCEHGPVSPLGPELVGLVRAAHAGGAAAVVRVLGGEPGFVAAQVGAVLDAGADAVLVPHARSAAVASAAVAGARRPPLGTRGAAPSVRGSAYALGDWRGGLRTPPLVMAMIEDPEAVEAIEEILAVDGLGLVFFGPFDLGMSLGLPDPSASDERVTAARRRVYDAARAAGVPVGDYAADAATAREFFTAGASLVSVSNDVSLLGTALAAGLAARG